MPTETVPAGPLDVTGKVQNPDGTPRAGAVAVLEPRYADAASGQIRTVSTASSDDDGLFRLRAPKAGMWRVTVRANGMLPMRHHLALGASETLPAVTLRPAVDLRVEITRAAAIPLAGAHVLASSGTTTGISAWYPAPREGKSGDDGLLILPRGHGEALRLLAQAPGHQSGSLEVDADNPTTAVRLDLAATTAVTGRVQNPDRQPIADAEVRLLRSGAPLGVPHVTHSRRNGDFAVQGLAPGEYKIRVAAPGYRTEEASVDVAENAALEDLLVVLAPR